jgi:hypothetical protein
MTTTITAGQARKLSNSKIEQCEQELEENFLLERINCTIEAKAVQGKRVASFTAHYSDYPDKFINAIENALNDNGFLVTMSKDESFVRYLIRW